jgi:iron complex transport system substrate-binding protein
MPTRRQLLAFGIAAGLASTSAASTRRIVSIGGAITETLFALGAGAELVGADTTSLYPAAARALPSVGYARQLSAEGVLSLRPTLVITAEEAGPPAVLRTLEAARIPLHVLDGRHRFEGMLERTRRIAALCGREAAGTALVAQAQADWAASREALGRRLRDAGGTRPSVLFVLSHAAGQIRVAGRDTAADAMIRYAGGRNPLAEGMAGYKPLTPEAAISGAPDIILATDQGLEATGGIDGLLTAPGLAQTPAGRARRVVALDALLLLGFGPRLPQAAAALGERFFAARA